MGEKIGIEEAKSNNVKYLTLRTGKICETYREYDESRQKDGFVPAQTKNKAGEITEFFAKNYDKLTGYVDNIKKASRDLPSGATITSYNIRINIGEDVKYILSVGTQERPYHRMLSVLGNINFNEPVRFQAFMDKRDPNNEQKVLLMYQGGDKPVQPKYRERWLSQLIAKKIKDGIELTEEELSKLFLDKKGKPSLDYPYIKQKKDLKWSFDDWGEYIEEKVEEEVIPAVKAAAEERGDFKLQSNTVNSSQVNSNDDLDEDGVDDVDFDYGDNKKAKVATAGIDDKDDIPW